jgi:phenylacetate-coenzyme A ligase PaaK-like adenylate-forming protein
LPGCRGLHLNEVHLLAEIVDPVTGQPSEHGELVFTTLAREGTPLLRYRSGDLGRRVACGCGLALRSFTIEGRIDDMFVAGDFNLLVLTWFSSLGWLARSDQDERKVSRMEHLLGHAPQNPADRT